MMYTITLRNSYTALFQIKQHFCKSSLTVKISKIVSVLLVSVLLLFVLYLWFVAAATEVRISQKQGQQNNRPNVSARLVEETVWANYYRVLRRRNEKGYVRPVRLLVNGSCQDQFYYDMEDNMIKVFNYPVIAEAKRKYRDMFKYFDEDMLKSFDQDPLSTLDQQIITNTSRTHPIVVTAASPSYFFKSLAMIKSFNTNLRPLYKDMKLMFFDLGLRPAQVRQLRTICKCEIRIFPFKKYPPFVSNLRNYIWKPIIIYQMLKQYDFVMWADASVSFSKNRNATDIFFSKAKERGILVRKLGDEHRSYHFTKKDTFKYLNETACLFDAPQIEATFITIWKTPFTMNYIIRPWLACALMENCMSHENPKTVLLCNKRDINSFHWCHRFDQSVLSIILQRIFTENYDMITLNRLPQIYQVERYHFFIP